MKLRWLLLMLPFLVLLLQEASAAAVATLDRQISHEGESVSLTISVDESVDDDPDFSLLNRDFEILHQSQSSNISIVNGSFSRSKQWQLSLMPKRVGGLTIPAISFGNVSTKVLKLQVLPAGTATTTDSSKDIFLEVTPDKKEVLLQEQVVLTVKLFRAVNLSQGDLAEPEIAQGVVKKLGEDRTYETALNQRRYVVTERVYALFPSAVGITVIPALQFQGTQVSVGGGVFARQTGKVIRIHSEPVNIRVKPKPDTWDVSQPWLPSSNLSLRELWSDNQNTTYKVGEPLTRTVELRGTGLTAAQLPVLFEAGDIDGFKQYPDQPSLQEENSADGLVGVRQEKVALIPTRAGELTLPGVSVAWWNVKTGAMQTVMIPARVIEVLPADGTTQSAQPPSASNQPAKTQSVPAQQQAAVGNGVTSEESSGWKIAAILFALAWLATMLLWWFKGGIRTGGSAVEQGDVETEQAVSLKQALKAMERSCLAGDASESMRLLVQWGALMFPEDKTGGVALVKGKSEAMDAAVAELEKSLYGKDAKSWAGADLIAAVKAIQPEQKSKKDVKGLKPLYR